MQINRHTYEEFFLLYIDNELNDEERKAVEDFILQNPDLESELRILQGSVLEPREHIVFNNKQSLYKNTAPANPVNETNYEEYFVLYGDGELKEELSACVRKFVEERPGYRQAFDLALSIKLEPDMHIVFPDKQLLYRNEKKNPKLIPIRWWRMAAAAVVLLSLGSLGWYYLGDKNNAQQGTPALADKTTNEKSAAQAKPPAVVAEPAPTDRSTKKQLPATTPIIKTNKKQTASATQTGKSKEHKPLPDASPETTPKQNETVLNGPVLKNPDPAVTEPRLVEYPQQEQPAATIIAKTTGSNAGIIAAINPPDRKTEQAAENDGAMIYVANTSVSKKNKLRGLFRTASRIIEKATNIEPPTKKHGFRVANIEIALQ